MHARKYIQIIGFLKSIKLILRVRLCLIQDLWVNYITQISIPMLTGPAVLET